MHRSTLALLAVLAAVMAVALLAGPAAAGPGGKKGASKGKAPAPLQPGKAAADDETEDPQAATPGELEWLKKQKPVDMQGTLLGQLKKLAADLQSDKVDAGKIKVPKLDAPEALTDDRTISVELQEAVLQVAGAAKKRFKAGSKVVDDVVKALEDDLVEKSEYAAIMADLKKERAKPAPSLLELGVGARIHRIDVTAFLAAVLGTTPQVKLWTASEPCAYTRAALGYFIRNSGGFVSLTYGSIGSVEGGGGVAGQPPVATNRNGISEANRLIRANMANALGGAGGFPAMAPVLPALVAGNFRVRSAPVRASANLPAALNNELAACLLELRGQPNGNRELFDPASSLTPGGRNRCARACLLLTIGAGRQASCSVGIVRNGATANDRFITVSGNTPRPAGLTDAALGWRFLTIGPHQGTVFAAQQAEYRLWIRRTKGGGRRSVNQAIAATNAVAHVCGPLANQACTLPAAGAIAFPAFPQGGCSEDKILTAAATRLGGGH